MARGTTVRAMFHLLLLLGLCTTGICLSRQYHFINEDKTWTEAQRYCRENYVDLASVVNAGEELALITSTDIRSSKQTWIGLYDDPTSWKWSLDDHDDDNEEGFYQGDEEKRFRNWFIQKPGKWEENRLCATFSSFNGAWQENDCSQVLPFVCFDGSRNTSEKYVVVNQYMTWTEARTHCREHYTDLISVRDENENQNIRSLLSNHFSYYNMVWIGLYRIRSWSDKSNSTFSNWKTGTPDNYDRSEYCAAVLFSDSDPGKWTEENCNQTIPFLCYNRTSPASARVYHFVSKSKTWLNAQRYCRENYTDLATVDNMEEMNTLLKTVNASYSGLAWIGLYDDLDSWRWSLDDNNFYKEGERTYRGWYHEPNNYNGKELCVVIRSDGTWADGDCNNDMNFVCYDGRNRTGYVWVNQYMNWTQAQHYCRQHHKDLASVRNQADNNQILNLIGGSQAWIGLYRTRLWSDQHDSTYENWRQATPYIPEQPDNGLYAFGEHGNQHCTAVSLEDSGQWTDEDCLATLPFICYNKYCAGSFCSHQYHFVLESKTWIEAQSYCRRNYSDLATINNMADMGKLLDPLYGIYSGSAWIGLYDDLKSWKWSLDDAHFYDEGERSFRNWFQYKQRNWFGNSLCVYFSGLDAVWWGASCYIPMAFVCFDARTIGAKRYVFVNRFMNWTEAQRYCRHHFTDLISVRNAAENQKIRSLLYGYNYSGDVWIGLYSKMSWSDQSDSSFTNWHLGKPDNYGQGKYCTAVFTESGQWTDEDCARAFPFVCYSSTASISNNYHFVNENKTWSEAQRYCRKHHSDLATIDNIDEMNTLFNTIKDSDSDLAWIGLYDNEDDWRWSLDDDSFYKEGEKEFRGWYHEPNNYVGKELCVSMYKTGEWLDKSCTQRLGFVCYNGTSKTHIWISEGMTWEEAQRYCRANHTDLASVRNETELQQILNITRGFDVWIGLYRNRVWSDQSKSTFTYWRPETQAYVIAEPDNGLYSYGQVGNQHCTVMDSTGKWTDENCFSSFPFFCYSVSTPGAVIGLQMKINVRGNLPDSQIKNRVLIQLQQELTRFGMSGKITLKVRNVHKIRP